ncbi:hypothetical protein BOTU111921_17000 [Bordetella tumbae]
MTKLNQPVKSKITFLLKIPPAATRMPPIYATPNYQAATTAPLNFSAMKALVAALW